MKEKFDGEVSISLKPNLEGPAMFDMCTAVSQKSGSGGSSNTPLPRFSKEFSYTTSELHNELQVPAGQEVAVWGLGANGQ